MLSNLRIWSRASVELGAADAAPGTVEEGLGIPCAEEDADPTARGQLPPEPPHRRPLLFLVGRLEHRVRLDSPRVHPLEQEVDRFGFAAPLTPVTITITEVIGIGQLALGVEKRRADARRFLQVGLLVDLVAQLRGFEHEGSRILVGQIPGDVDDDHAPQSQGHQGRASECPPRRRPAAPLPRTWPASARRNSR